jgi:hypothetical protein
MIGQLLPISLAHVPKLVAAGGERASMSFFEFLAANIRNPHTRCAYYWRRRNFSPGAPTPECLRSRPFSQCMSDMDRGGDARAGRAERHTTARRDPSSFRLARHRSGAAGQPGRVGARASACGNVRTNADARAMANHASTRTTQLYDRRRDEVSLDEIERIVI